MNFPISLLLVANYSSDVGYAWWLMESFWVILAERYCKHVDIILAYPKINSLPPHIENAPLKVVEYDMATRSWRTILGQCKFLIQHRVRAIYFTDMPTWHWSYVFYHLAGVRFIVTHDHAPGERASITGYKTTIKRIIHHLPWLSVDGAIGATDFVRQRLVDVACIPEWKCFSAPNGLPPANDCVTSIDPHQYFGIPQQRKIVIMTGRAHRYKGIEFVLQCLKVCLTYGEKNLHFLFLGDGPHLEFFKKTAQQLGCSANCTFPGKCDDIMAFLQGADMAIHPSQGEVGYSLSILEYMCAGLPVVVPDDPSVCGATVHLETGIIYPRGSVKAATDALLRLLNDDHLRRIMGRNAREIVATKYSLDRTHQALVEAFNQIDKNQILRPVQELEQ